MTEPIPEIKIKDDLEGRVEKLKDYMNKQLSSPIFKIVQEKIE